MQLLRILKYNSKTKYNQNFCREMGMTTISGLLMADKQDPEPFQEAFEALIEWSWRYPDKTKVWRKTQFENQCQMSRFLFFAYRNLLSCL